MGTIFAPTYTNLTMGYLETKDYSAICQSYVLYRLFGDND